VEIKAREMVGTRIRGKKIKLIFHYKKGITIK